MPVFLRFFCPLAPQELKEVGIACQNNGSTFVFGPELGGG